MEWLKSSTLGFHENNKEALSLAVYAPDLGIELTYPFFQRDTSSTKFTDLCATYASRQRIAPEIPYSGKLSREKMNFEVLGLSVKVFSVKIDGHTHTLVVAPNNPFSTNFLLLPICQSFLP